MQLADVKEEAVSELSKQIREAQRLQEQRQGDAVSQLPLCLTDDPREDRQFLTYQYAYRCSAC